MPVSPTNMPTVAEKNRQMVLSHLRLKGQLSRQQLARLTGLDSSTLSKMVKQMKSVGFLSECGKTKAHQLGKKQVLLEISSELPGKILGVWLFQDCVEYAVIDIGARIIEQKSLPAISFLDQLFTLINEIQKKYALISIGLALPGLIDSSEGKVLLCPLKYLEIPDLVSKTANFANCPVFLENAANAAAISQINYSDTEGKSQFYLKLSFAETEEGVFMVSRGSSLIIRGDIFTGDHFSAGELSPPLLPSFGIEFSQSDLELLGESEAELRSKHLQLIEEIFSGLGAICCFIDPSAVIISANISLKNRMFYEILSEKVNSFSFLGKFKIPVLPARYFHDASAIGAAYSALNQLDYKSLYS